jgi:hypothetical protein
LVETLGQARENGRDLRRRFCRRRPSGWRARQAWAEYGQVIVCDDDAEMVREADRIAS